MYIQSCPTLCNTINYSPGDSSVHGMFLQDYWSELSFPSLRDLPNAGIEPTSPVPAALQVNPLRLIHQGMYISNSKNITSQRHRRDTFSATFRISLHTLSGS